MQKEFAEEYQTICTTLKENYTPSYQTKYQPGVSHVSCIVNSWATNIPRNLQMKKVTIDYRGARNLGFGLKFPF